MGTTADRIKAGMEIRGLKQTDLVEKTGISKGALSSYISGRYTPKQNNIYLIAKALNVNEAWLMGADVPMDKKTDSLTKRDTKCIEKILDATREQLLSQEGLMFEGGQPATQEQIDSILSAMQIGMEMAKKKNKEKYTPKKYKKD